MYLLKVQTNEAYSIKVLVELLQNYIKEACFVFDNEGISLTGMDTKRVNGTKLVILKLKQENFKNFYVSKHIQHPINVGVNVGHLYRMLKSIKKKDTLTLFIKESNKSELEIEIQQNGNSTARSGNIKIQNIHPLSHVPQDEYTKSVVCTAKEFQELKSLNKISKYIKVVSTKGKFEFSCDKPDVYKGKVTLGCDDETISNNSHSNEEKTENLDDENDDFIDEYEQTFETEQIIQLIKVAGLSNTVQIFADPYMSHRPLLFKLSIGHLGNISVFLKSKECIESKNDDEDS